MCRDYQSARESNEVLEVVGLALLELQCSVRRHHSPHVLDQLADKSRDLTPEANPEAQG